MKKFFAFIVSISIVAFIVFAILYSIYDNDILFSLSLTCGTFAYHFVYRLLVGLLFNILKKRGKIKGKAKMYKIHKFENELYRALNVTKWKNHYFTYDKTLFTVDEKDLSNLYIEMCKAELVHIVNLPLSFISLLFCFFTNEPQIYVWVFFATAFVSNFLDLIPIIIQRYNRPRVERLMVLKAHHQGGHDYEKV